MKEKMNENIKKLMNDIVFYNLNHNEKIKDIILAEKNIIKCLDPEKIWNTEYNKNIKYNERVNEIKEFQKEFFDFKYNDNDHSTPNMNE